MIITHQVWHSVDFLELGLGINPLELLFEDMANHRLSAFWQADEQDQLSHLRVDRQVCHKCA